MVKSMLTSERPAESRAGDVLLLPIAGLAFWTLAYQLVLLLRWPATTITWCFLAIAIAGFLLALFETATAKMRVFRVPQFLGAALMLGLLGTLLLFVSRSF